MLKLSGLYVNGKTIGIGPGRGDVSVSAANHTAFDTFHFPDGMIGEALEMNFGADIEGSTGQHPSPSTELAEAFTALAGDAFNATSPFAPESYDAAALIMLAMQSAGSADPADYKSHVMGVANPPGMKIGAGELAKGLEILANGGEIDYVGASGVELVGPGEAAGTYREIVVKDGKITTASFR